MTILYFRMQQKTILTFCIKLDQLIIKTVKQMSQPKNDIQQQIQNDSTLRLVANGIVNQFNSLYSKLDRMKQKAANEKQIEQLTSMENKIDHLAVKTLSESQNLTATMKRTNVEWEIENLKQQLQIMQQRHSQLQVKQEELEQRVTDLECNMVSREQFEQLKGQCTQQFSMFDNRLRVIKEQNDKVHVYMDDKFKRSIMPSQQFKLKLSELMKTNYRMFEYGKKLYWSIMNQILAYRALSTGLVQRGEGKSGIQETQLFKEVVNVVGNVTFLIAGIPLAGSVFLIVKDLSSIFFNKREEVMTHNIRLRVEGYFTEDEIAEDVARAVLELLSNPLIQKRVAEFRTKAMIMSALCKFFDFIAKTDFSSETLTNIFISKLTKMKKEKESANDYLIENVVTDTALIMWKVADSLPAQRRFPISAAARTLFNKNEQPLKPYNNNSSPQNSGYLQDQNHGFVLQQSVNNESSKLKDSELSVASTNETVIANETKISVINSQVGQTSNIAPNWSAVSSSQQNSSQRPPYFKLAILRADLSLKKQLFSKANPYCLVKYSNKLMRTETHKTVDMKPIWNQQYIFEATESPSTITIEVYDKERVLKDDFLGSASIIDSQLNKAEQEVQLWDQGRAVGKIYIRLQP